MAKTKPSLKPRPKITGITLNIAYPDGRCRTVTLDPKEIEGLFWSDRTVLRILAPFYTTFEVDERLENVMARGDAHLKPLFEGKTKRRVDPAYVEALWNTPDESGDLPAFIKKSHPCIPN